jgi:hypothetical protein
MAVFPGAGSWTQEQVQYVMSSVALAGGIAFLDHFIENKATINMNFVDEIQGTSKHTLGTEISEPIISGPEDNPSISIKITINVLNRIVANQMSKEVRWQADDGSDPNYILGNCDVLIHEFGHAIADLYYYKMHEQGNMAMYDYYRSRILNKSNGEKIADEFVNAVRSHWGLPLIPTNRLRGEGINGFNPNAKFWGTDYWGNND